MRMAFEHDCKGEPRMSRTVLAQAKPPMANELPDYVKDALAQENPSRFFTMSKEQTADYLISKGVPTNKHAIVRAIYDGKLASKRIGKKRLVSEYDALIFALSGREFFGQESEQSA